MKDIKTTTLGLLKEATLVMAVFGLPHLSPDEQVTIAKAVAIGYAFLGALKAYFTKDAGPEGSKLDISGARQ